MDKLKNWQLITAFYMIPQIANLVAWSLTSMIAGIVAPGFLVYACFWFLMSSIATFRLWQITRRMKKLTKPGNSV